MFFVTWPCGAWSEAKNSSDWAVPGICTCASKGGCFFMQHFATKTICFLNHSIDCSILSQNIKKNHQGIVIDSVLGAKHVWPFRQGLADWSSLCLTFLGFPCFWKNASATQFPKSPPLSRKWWFGLCWFSWFSNPCLSLAWNQTTSRLRICLNVWQQLMSSTARSSQFELLLQAALESILQLGRNELNTASGLSIP